MLTNSTAPASVEHALLDVAHAVLRAVSTFMSTPFSATPGTAAASVAFALLRVAHALMRAVSALMSTPFDVAHQQRARQVWRAHSCVPCRHVWRRIAPTPASSRARRGICFSPANPVFRIDYAAWI